VIELWFVDAGLILGPREKSVGFCVLSLSLDYPTASINFEPICALFVLLSRNLMDWGNYAQNYPIYLLPIVVLRVLEFYFVLFKGWFAK